MTIEDKMTIWNTILEAITPYQTELRKYCLEFQENFSTLTILIILCIIVGVISLLLGTAILWNQRKIKKMLEEMQKSQEARTERDGDKPAEEGV